jgi:hypothetical protein
MKTLPVLDWLIETLKKSRDTRAILNRKQGLLSYNRAFKKKEGPTGEEIHDDNTQELGKMKTVIFNGAPKRIYKTNRNIEEVPIQDPMRVHQALREYGDESASRVFTHMIDAIKQIEEEETANSRRSSVAGP